MVSGKRKLKPRRAFDYFDPRGTAEPLADVGREARPGGEFGSFINAVRSRKREDLNAEILEGHYSSALCHLANISYRLGYVVPFKNAETPGDDKQVERPFKAIEDNLKNGIGLKLEDTMVKVGPALTFDPPSERFVGDGADEANELLTREPRGP